MCMWDMIMCISFELLLYNCTMVAMQKCRFPRVSTIQYHAHACAGKFCLEYGVATIRIMWYV